MSISDMLAELFEDPRIDRCKLHKLGDILLLSLYGVFCGAKDWAHIHLICMKREKELREFLALKNGIPSVCTFRRVMSRIKPKALSQLLENQGDAMVGSLNAKTIAIDGKTIRGSFDRKNGDNAIHCLSAFVVEDNIVIRQEFGEKKESEITMIPQLLMSILDMVGATVTIDAMGCQVEIIKDIIAHKADYVIGLKGNQPSAYQDVIELFAMLRKSSSNEGISCWQEYNKDHGRIEDRSVMCADLSVYPLESLKKFKGVKSVACVNSVVERNGNQTQEYRYYITSLPAEADRVGRTIRAHWSIENSLHYVLDVVYDEDGNRSRTNHLASNFNTIRKIVLNTLRKNQKDKSKSLMMLEALLDPQYAFELMIKSGILQFCNL